MTNEKPFESKPGIIQKLKRRFLRNKGLRESLETVIESHAQENGEPSLAADARSMLGNLLGFSELRVDDLMVPRADIDAIEESSTLRILLDAFTKSSHSRLPVYRETLDDVQGFIHVKDFLKWMTSKGNRQKAKKSDTAGLSLPASELSSKISQHNSLKRDVLFVPPSMPASDLLVKMKASHVHLAIVVDEYGGTDGLVSFEDLVEAIVGDIADEHDADDELSLIKKQSDGTFIANARVAISTLDQMFGLELLPEDQKEEADTLAGLLFEMGGRIPSRGETVIHQAGLQFEILDSDARMVKRVRISRILPQSLATDIAGEDSG
jgi:CBS domain containing-hemolysin-like protein